MNIIVCIKQIPIEASIQVDPHTGRLKRDSVESIINPYDEYAIEEGVRLREKLGGKVTVVTMGPPQAESVLRESIARGADDAVLVSDKAFAGADTLATSYTLSKAIETIGNYDLIICGKQSGCGDTSHVGPSLAQLLDIAHISCVKKIEVLVEKNSIKVERVMDDGCDLIEANLPVLLSVVKEINKPRVSSLKGKMLAKKAIIKMLDASSIGADEEKIGLLGSPTQVVNTFNSPKKPSGEKLVGDAKEVAVNLVKKLSDLGIV